MPSQQEYGKFWADQAKQARAAQNKIQAEHDKLIKDLPRKYPPFVPFTSINSGGSATPAGKTSGTGQRGRDILLFVLLLLFAGAAQTTFHITSTLGILLFGFAGVALCVLAWKIRKAIFIIATVVCGIYLLLQFARH
jgi:hypothetical protein